MHKNEQESPQDRTKNRPKIISLIGNCKVFKEEIVKDFALRAMPIFFLRLLNESSIGRHAMDFLPRREPYHNNERLGSA